MSNKTVLNFCKYFKFLKNKRYIISYFRSVTTTLNIFATMSRKYQICWILKRLKDELETVIVQRFLNFESWIYYAKYFCIVFCYCKVLETLNKTVSLIKIFIRSQRIDFFFSSSQYDVILKVIVISLQFLFQKIYNFV